LQLISQNQEAFIRMINEPEGGPAAGGGGEGGEGGALGGALGGGQGVIQVTPQDKEAIERVSAKTKRPPSTCLYCSPCS